MLGRVCMRVGALSDAASAHPASDTRRWMRGRCVCTDCTTVYSSRHETQRFKMCLVTLVTSAASRDVTDCGASVVTTHAGLVWGRIKSQSTAIKFSTCCCGDLGGRDTHLSMHRTPPTKDHHSLRSLLRDFGGWGAVHRERQQHRNTHTYTRHCTYRSTSATNGDVQ